LHGQLGDGTTIRSLMPKQIGGDWRWVSIEAPSYRIQFEHSIGLKSDGTLWAWGDNDYGQLGDGSTTERYLPKKTGTDNKWVSIAAGDGHTLALKSDGSLWAWGMNDDGQIGTAQRPFAICR